MDQRITIRTAQVNDAENIARVQVETWRTAYRGIVPDERLATLDPEKSAESIGKLLEETGDGPFGLVAEVSGEVVGFAIGGPARDGQQGFDGELWGIYVRKENQQCGIGRRLVSTVAERLIRQGHRSMLVWVLAENPYRRFYESLGGEPVGEKEIVIGGKTLGEIAYGWRDIGILVSALCQPGQDSPTERESNPCPQ
jgi:GNAT superfamily N-acetyltransferase